MLSSCLFNFNLTKFGSQILLIKYKYEIKEIEKSTDILFDNITLSINLFYNL